MHKTLKLRVDAALTVWHSVRKVQGFQLFLTGILLNTGKAVLVFFSHSKWIVGVISNYFLFIFRLSQIDISFTNLAMAPFQVGFRMAGIKPRQNHQQKLIMHCTLFQNSKILWISLKSLIRFIFLNKFVCSFIQGI